MKVHSLFSTAILCGAILVSIALPSARADSADFDVRPLPVKTPPPKYPADLRRDGITGSVAVRILVDEQGNVAECSVAKSSHPGFEEPALAAIRNWKFKPASKGGAAVPSKIVVPLMFNAEA